MSKSILAIDTPKNCGQCPCFLEVATDCCGVNGKDIDSHSKPDWCPLKSVPQKMEEENRWFSEDYAKGRNACIDEILKGVNKDE
jgi:hypothetical protein